ncbi:hypothetical protein D3C76_965110 [compost metagenome]
MPAICSRASGSNTTTSSIRLMNSGRKCTFTASITAARCASRSPTSSWICAEPRLEVITTTVLRKSTVRPWLSVRRPSSSTCRRMLNTSGWAFSTSSISTTEYGLRRTASVR